VPQQRTRIVDRTFALALAIKGIDGALELIGGLVLFVVPPSAISLVFRSLTQHELSEDPHDSSRCTFGLPPSSSPGRPRSADSASSI